MTAAPPHGKGAAAFRQPYRGRSLANPELGAKQICPSCSTKFYDLTRRPAVCPKCATSFDPEEALRSRRVRARAILPEDDVEETKVVAPEAEVEDGFEPEPDEAKELDEVVDEPPLVSGDDDDVEPDAAAPAADEDLGVDFAEEEEDLEDAEDDDFPADEIDGLPEGGDTDDR